jgi:hypothetical protein
VRCGIDGGVFTTTTAPSPFVTVSVTVGLVCMVMEMGAGNVSLSSLEFCMYLLHVTYGRARREIATDERLTTCMYMPVRITVLYDAVTVKKNYLLLLLLASRVHPDH